ncbi:MAG: uracil-DNA glycosylase family protein [Hyphomicrobiales bacterium]
MRREEAAALIEWLVEMGADEIVADQAIDRFQPVPSTPAVQLSPREPAVAAPPLVNPTGNAVDDAKAIAAACRTLKEIIAALKEFDACPLKRTATQLALCDGNPQAHVMCIGEAPGREEDLQGKPFVGRSGQLLDRMLSAIGLSRNAEDPAQAAFITNVIFWRPPGNRTPTEQETLMCLPFLKRTIEILKPRAILCVGATPTQRLSGRTDGILKLRGKWFDFATGEVTIPMLATLHPAYLLRNPAHKRLAWRDLLSLRKALDAQ